MAVLASMTSCRSSFCPVPRSCSVRFCRSLPTVNPQCWSIIMGWYSRPTWTQQQGTHSHPTPSTNCYVGSGWSRDSSVATTAYELNGLGLMPDRGKKLFSFPESTDGFWDPPSLLSYGYQGHRIAVFFFLLFQSSVIPENRKHDVSEAGSFSVLRWSRKTPTQFDPLERSNLNHWPSILPFTSGRKQIQFPKRRVFYSLEYMTMEKVQKRSNSGLYTTFKTLWNLRVLRDTLGIKWPVREADN
jgi:hypothetical protein